MDIWTPDHLQTYLTEHAIPDEIVHLAAETPTVPADAEAMGVSADQIEKTVVFLIDEAPHAILANGERRVDYRYLTARSGVYRDTRSLSTGSTATVIT